MSDRGFPEWDELYRTQAAETLPWYHPVLDPDLERALARYTPAQRALDLGTGPGSQAIALAERGFSVTGTDISAVAVEQCRARAQAAGLRIDFVQDDITQSKLRGPFDLVFDRGCFHVLAPEQRAGYVQTLAQLLAPQGYFFLKCFSHQQPGEIGPYKFHPDDIAPLFAPALTLLGVEHAIYQGTFQPPPRALFCVLQRAAG